MAAGVDTKATEHAACVERRKLRKSPTKLGNTHTTTQGKTSRTRGHENPDTPQDEATGN